MGRGTTRQAPVCAVSRGGRPGPGMCSVGVVPDAAGGACSRFAEGHVGVLSHVRADMWPGVTAGPGDGLLGMLDAAFGRPEG